MRYFFLILLWTQVLCSSCKKRQKITRIGDFVNILVSSERELPAKNLDPDLMKYVYQFVKDAKDHGVFILQKSVDRLRSIQYVDNLTYGGGVGVIAACNRYYTSNKKLKGLTWESTKSKWLTIEILRNENFTMGSKHKLKEFTRFTYIEILTEFFTTF